MKLKPWDTAIFDVADANAVQALARGEATGDQQKRALSWIINRCCLVGKLPFATDAEGGERGTNVLLGRQFVGNQIMRLANTNLEALRAEVHNRKGDHHE